MKELEKEIKFKITEKELKNHEAYFEDIRDYPIYASTSGIGRVLGVLIAKMLYIDFEQGFGNDTTLEVVIKVKKRVKINYRKSPSNYGGTLDKNNEINN